MSEARGLAMEHMKKRSGAIVVTPNPEIVMLSRKNAELSEALTEADLVLADGIGIIYGAKILRRPLKEKLPGIDFIQGLFPLIAEKNMSIFLLGAKPGVAEKAAQELENRFSGLKIAGTNDGYFTDDEYVLEKINAVAPDLLLVCLGSPKQELWLKENAKKLDVGLMGGFGGALDVFAGVAQRAPERWQRLGLEWLYRIKSDPARISRLGALPKFGFAVLGAALKKK